jgi:RNA polymerase sigma factor (sigma-70 family)
LALSPAGTGGGIIRAMRTEVGTTRSDLAPEAVYARYAHELTRFATVLVGPADAGDVVSDAMLHCFGSAGWAEVDDVRAYLHQAVLNQARQWARSGQRRRRREVAFGRLHEAVAGTEPDGAGVWDAVLGLSVRQRAVVYLAYWEDLTPSRIADRLSISEGAVRRHLARAREHLRKVLNDDRV